VTATGQVVFSANGVEIGSAALVNGVAKLAIGPGQAAAKFTITASYQGDPNVATSASAPTELRVVKADATVRGKATPRRVVVDRTAPKLHISVRAAGQVVTGKVRVNWRGKSRVVSLKGGKATLNLGSWKNTGVKVVRIAYLGSGKANPDEAAVFVKVRAKRRG
jgi:5'-nucleotidase